MGVKKVPAQRNHGRDRLSADDRSKLMARVSSTNTWPELRLRRMLYRLGYRYRLHAAALPGRPDIVFPGRKKAIFVHGCFWHGHDCKSGRNAPKSNTGYWGPKLRRNQERDATALKMLADLGWDTLIVWECDLRQSAESVLHRVVQFLG